jgi:hypothetical protein
MFNLFRYAEQFFAFPVTYDSHHVSRSLMLKAHSHEIASRLFMVLFHELEQWCPVKVPFNYLRYVFGVWWLYPSSRLVKIHIGAV